MDIWDVDIWELLLVLLFGGATIYLLFGGVGRKKNGRGRKGQKIDIPWKSWLAGVSGGVAGIYLLYFKFWGMYSEKIGESPEGIFFAEIRIPLLAAVVLVCSIVYFIRKWTKKPNDDKTGSGGTGGGTGGGNPPASDGTKNKRKFDPNWKEHIILCSFVTLAMLIMAHRGTSCYSLPVEGMIVAGMVFITYAMASEEALWVPLFSVVAFPIGTALWYLAGWSVFAPLGDELGKACVPLWALIPIVVGMVVFLLMESKRAEAGVWIIALLIVVF